LAEAIAQGCLSPPAPSTGQHATFCGMWLFGGGSSGSNQAADDEERKLLLAEAEELRLKLEALQAADHRAEQRASVAAKEKRLQDMMDDFSRSQQLQSGTSTAAASQSDPLEADDDDAQQSQEPPMACVAGPKEKQLLLGMSQIAEELTEALEVSRECEDKTRLELESLAARLEAESATRRHRESEIASLQAMLAAERVRTKAVEERMKRVLIEDRMQRAFAEKRKEYHLHLEV